ncbi:hypothetical protein GF385_01315 [Candidatus Dependentiae bacterium]|nr:hypothetical protein [Candidatus Dependentiae bacterium]
MIRNTKFTFFLLILLVFTKIDSKQLFIMINPAGHAKNIGRKLVEGYERSVTFKMAEVLKQKLEERYGIRCVLTRYPGEEIVDLQNASFANRLGIDFYLDLRIYRQEFIKPKIFIYNLVFNPISDFATRVFDPYKFIPINQAHFFNINITKSYGLRIKESLTKKHNKRNFDCFGVFGVPLRPLKGIIAPALCVEIGICDQEQWKNLTEPIVESLGFLVEN